MIYINLALKNPFTKEEFSNVFAKYGNLSKHKAWELEAYKNASVLISFELNINWRGQDHAGPILSLGLFGYEVVAKLYDIRHWNSRKNCWEVHTD